MNWIKILILSGLLAVVSARPKEGASEGKPPVIGRSSLKPFKYIKLDFRLGCMLHSCIRIGREYLIMRKKKRPYLFIIAKHKE